MGSDLEAWDRKWEITRKRGKLSYLAVRGLRLSAIWFVANISGLYLFKYKMSFESMAFVSLLFFLFGCWDGQQHWNDAERRYWDMVKLRNLIVEDHRLKLDLGNEVNE